MRLGLSDRELQREIQLRIERMDEAQEDGDHLGGYADLLRTSAVMAFQRAAELISLNNDRISEQLEELLRAR